MIGRVGHGISESEMKAAQQKCYDRLLSRQNGKQPAKKKQRTR